MARAVADADGIEIGDLLGAQTYEAAAELAGDRDLVDLTVYPGAGRTFCEQGHRFKMLAPDQARTLRTW